MSEAVTVPGLMMMTSILFQESLTRDRYTDKTGARTHTHAHTHTHKHSGSSTLKTTLQSKTKKAGKN